MDNLFKAIYEQYQADNALVAALSGGLHLNEAPQKTAFPYATFQLVNDSPLNDMVDSFSEDHETCLIQFNLFSSQKSSVEVSNLFTKFKAAFDYCQLVIEDYEPIAMQRISANLLRADDVWQYNITYRVILEYTGEPVELAGAGHLYDLIGL